MNGFRGILRGTLMLSVALSCAAAAAEAQNTINKNSPEVRALITGTLGIKEGSRHFRRLTTGYDSRNVQHPSEPVKVIKHLRGKEGISFPTHEQINAISKKAPPAQQKPITAPVPKEVPLADRELTLASYVQDNRLPRCTANVTSKKPTGRKAPASGVVTTAFDMLFVDPAHVPYDARDAFGENVKIRAYDPRMKNTLVPAAMGIGVRCLPTRIRATEEFVVWSEGLPALKNYAQDPYGEGILFESVKELISK